MFKFIVLVSLLAVCQTAPHPLNDNNPTLQPQPTLPRPSPINPDIPSDPKPEEKITLINDKNKAKPQEVALDIPKPKEQPQKRQAAQGTMNHDDCHNPDPNKDQKVAAPKGKDAKDDKEKGIIKRAATSTEIPKKTREESETPNKQSDKPLHCTGEECDHSGEHANSKREAETSRSTESPATASKGKSKPYVATKPESFSQKAKRQINKEEEAPNSQPQPEQPDEGDNKKTPQHDLPKREISDPLMAMDKPRDPNFESEKARKTII